jgi:hypothetical protein
MRLRRSSIFRVNAWVSNGVEAGFRKTWWAVVASVRIEAAKMAGSRGGFCSIAFRAEAPLVSS